TKIISVPLEITPNPATKAIETPSSSPMGTMWCLCDPTPSGWCKTRIIDQSAGGKLHDRNAKESWALLEDLALYDNESWNDPRDFVKPVKEISCLKMSQDNDHNAPVSTEEEVIEETEELGEETKEETKEEEEDDPEYFDTFPTDTSSVIDPYLGGMVLGKPFTKETGLICDRDEGTITFERDKGKITFKIPHKMERFKRIDKDILKTDNILPFLIIGDDSDQEKTYYLNSLNLGPTYRRDESMTKEIQCLIKMKSRADEGGVT
nr:MAK10-like protein [Tanacetum cinerariifolium]